MTKGDGDILIAGVLFLYGIVLCGVSAMGCGGRSIGRMKGCERRVRRVSDQIRLCCFGHGSRCRSGFAENGGMARWGYQFPAGQKKDPCYQQRHAPDEPSSLRV